MTMVRGVSPSILGVQATLAAKRCTRQGAWIRYADRHPILQHTLLTRLQSAMARALTTTASLLKAILQLLEKYWPLPMLSARRPRRYA